MRLLRRLHSLFRIRSLEDELAEEMEFHREMKKRELEQAGPSERDAASAAARAMGNMTVSRENARGVWLPVFFDSLLQDCAYAIRNLRRQPGFAIVTIGASRTRITRQLLTESLILASAAGLAGIGIAYVLPPAVLARVAGQPPNLKFEPDLNLLVFSVILAVVTTILFGLAPALHATRMSVTGELKEGSSGSRLRLRSTLLGVQVAVSVILLVSAGHMMRGVQQASKRNPGFTVSNVSVVSFDLPANSYDAPRIRSLVAELQAGLRTRGKPPTLVLLSGAASRLIRSLLYGLNALDVTTYASVCLAILMVATAASWLPARRAMRVEPVQALRYE
jgi:hypothetical protein